MADDKGISFRINEDRYKVIADLADANGETPTGWCRKVIEQLADGGTPLTGTERLIFMEIARMRYLFGCFVGLMLEKQLTPGRWKELLKEADAKGDLLASTILKARTEKKEETGATQEAKSHHG